MREIKFRAWDVDYKCWIPAEECAIDFSGNLWTKNEDGNFRKETINYVLEQFTGLKDKNGREIYEGDIVRAVSHNPQNYRIEFLEGGFCATWKGGDGYPIDINHFYSSAGCDIEVIGNIYDNPELLK